MARKPENPDRREFLKAVAGAAALATPMFATLGADAAEQTAFERAQHYLGNAQSLVAQARDAEGAAQRQLATEAQTELTEAQSAAQGASPAERDQLRAPMAAVAREINSLLRD